MKKTTKKENVQFDYRTIKSFEDACKKENLDPTKLPDVSMIPKAFRNAIINCYKLYIIFKAINNDWVADWSNWNQSKYYPWFAVKSSGSGFDFSDSYYDYDSAITAVGSCLCTDTSEKALYIANTFGEEYKEFFLIEK